MTVSTQDTSLALPLKIIHNLAPKMEKVMHNEMKMRVRPRKRGAKSTKRYGASLEKKSDEEEEEEEIHENGTGYEEATRYSIGNKKRRQQKAETILLLLLLLLLL